MALAVKIPSANAGDVGSIPGCGRSPGGVNGSPLQYSCLENSTDRGAWWATVHGVAKSWIQLSMHDISHQVYHQALLRTSCNTKYVELQHILACTIKILLILLLHSFSIPSFRSPLLTVVIMGFNRFQLSSWG